METILITCIIFYCIYLNFRFKDLEDEVIDLTLNHTEMEIKVYNKMMEIRRDLKNEKLEDSISGTCINEYIGSVGDKIEGQAEIINSFYAKNYESYVFTAIYDNKFLVNFWNKEEIGSIGDTFTIKARIKRLAKSKQYTGAWETQLNYVKKV